ncbi:MAG: MerC domain-containing protein [Erythrobacter sp.]|nr:MerC domain-containing protein [Erythrobacter sp.]
MSGSQPSARVVLDRVGIGLAGLCAVHCLATLVLLSGLGLSGHFLLAHEIHEVGLVAALGVAAIAIGWGFMRHGRLRPLLVALIGLAFMGAALVLGHSAQEAVLTIIGVTFVSIGHLLNLREAGRCAF